MAKEYTKEQLWKVYEKLPQELREAIFAEETAESIWSICEKNEISEQVSQVAKYVGRVLLGILLPEEFQQVLKGELKLSPEAAKKVAQEINRFIFYPVKPSLEELYKIEITPPARLPITPSPDKPSAKAIPSEIKPETMPEKESASTKTAAKEKPTFPQITTQKEDTYREPIENE